MSKELEVSILGVDAPALTKKIIEMGAKKTQDVRLSVDWYRPCGIKEGEDPWYLRIRSYGEGTHEVTWKAKSTIAGVGRTHKEINFIIPEPEKLADLFEELGLEHYAHQEKDRTSFTLGSLAFDFDTYPKMPTLMEIEAPEEKDLDDAIQMLGVESYQTWNQGERKLVQQVYKLDWYDMRF